MAPAQIKLHPITLMFLSEEEESEYNRHISIQRESHLVPIILSSAYLHAVGFLFFWIPLFRNEAFMQVEGCMSLISALWVGSLRLSSSKHVSNAMLAIVYAFLLYAFKVPLHSGGLAVHIQHNTSVELWMAICFVTLSYLSGCVFSIPWIVVGFLNASTCFGLWKYVGYTGPDLIYMFPFVVGFFFSTLAAHTAEHRDRTNFKLLSQAQAGLSAKSTFLANQNHEMRTLLNGIIGMQDLLSETGLTEQQSEYLGTIHKCSESLLSMVCDVLDLEKANAGKLDIRRAPMDMRDCVEAVCDMLSVVAQSNDVELAAYVDEALPTPVLGDKLRFKQILINLVSNAIKFSAKSKSECGAKPQVMIRARALQRATTARPIATVLFEVQDNGIGIRKEHLSLLFSPFSQVNTSHTRVFQGTGLGLSICKKLCEAMDGSVSVTSVEGVGSTFAFSVPFEVCNPARPIAEAPTHMLGPHGEWLDSSSGHEVATVLLVAPDACTREAVVQNLWHLGVRCVTCSSIRDITGSVVEYEVQSGTNHWDSTWTRPTGVRARTPSARASTPQFFQQRESSVQHADAPPALLRAPVDPRESPLAQFRLLDSAEAPVADTGPVLDPSAVRLVLVDAKEVPLDGTAPAVIARLTAWLQRPVPILVLAPLRFRLHYDQLAEQGLLASTMLKPPKLGALSVAIARVLHGAADGDLATTVGPDVVAGAGVGVAAGERMSVEELVAATQDGAGGMAMAHHLHGAKRKRAEDDCSLHEPPRPWKILCAEDNPINQRVLGGYLTKLGYEHDFVPDGRDAVERAQTAEYGLILMDIQMPVMSGFEATAEIRRLEQLGQITHRHVIVGCSANALSESRDSSFESGMDAFITKPVRKQELQTLLESYFLSS